MFLFIERNRVAGWHALIVSLLLVVLFAVSPSLSYAQPANNNWNNALEISIPNDDFGIGVFQSDTVNLTGATNQPGEYLQNPTYNKTVWYKFSVPSHRLVRVKVLQPTEILQSTDAGFFVYHSTPAIPGMTDLAVYTPMFSLASYSENVCLEQGEYFVQVIAKNGANSEVFVELDVSYTYPVSTSHAHDQMESAYNFGTLAASHSVNFSWDCLSIQSPQEYNSYFGTDSLDYTKSIWYRFTTDSHVDLYSFFVNYPNYSFNNQSVSIRIFEGVVTTATMDTTTAIYSIVRPLNGSLTHLPCLLKPNTEYYIQILGRITYTGSSNFQMRHLGEGVTTGAYPHEAGWNSLNDFGTVVPTPSPGVTLALNDYFSCEALLSNDSIQCSDVNPVDNVTIGAYTYDLTTWFTLDLTAAANVLLRAYTKNQYCNWNCYDHKMYVRIFNQTPDNDCANLTLTGSLYYEGVFDVNGAIVMNCLPIGKYSIQLLARSGLTADPYHCYNSQFGRQVNLSMNFMGVPNTQYALQNTGDVDWINVGLPLQKDILYTADSSSFSCDKTVIPDTAICSNIVDRAMYRQFIIGDADNDAVLDSGMVTIENYNYYNVLQNHLVKSPFYKGDADQLATAQGVFSWPDQITGLDPYDGCNMYNNFFRPNWPYDIPHNPKKYCVTPGTYTLVNVGDSTENGAIMAPRFRFTKKITNHWNPANAYDMGDIIAQGLNILSPADTFSCRDNPETIGGLGPCDGFTKLIYREFYLNTECRVTVTENSGTNSPYSRLRVYSGRVSVDGIAGLTPAPYQGTGCYTGSYSQPPCATVPEGWYTVVSYGYGPTYDNNYAFHEATTYNNYTNLYNIDHTSSIRVVADTTVPPGPFYNRPFKACVANNDNPLTWVNTGTTSIPSAATDYTLCTERFKPVQDTPYANIPILGCANTVRLAFYVFTTDDEYYVRISGIDGYNKELFPLDVRTADSLLLPTTTPIAGCTNTGNIIEVCRLQPGTYTLVVYGTPTQDCVTFTPVVSVQPVDISRFDFASQAYDFDVIPGDGQYYGGKVGEVHPSDPTLLPSNDFFYCTTGAFASDPGGSCINPIYPPIYPDQPNNVYYQEPGTQTWYKRRNLWYTFVAQGMGKATMKIRNLTNPSKPITFRMFYSNVDGSIPFDNLLALGELDSTVAMGLTPVHDNIDPYSYFCRGLEETTYTYISDICEIDTVKRRYYIVADLNEYYTSLPNVQMDLQLKWIPIIANPQDPKYDFYSHANVIGNNEDAPPYTSVPLDYNTIYTGGWGNMSCATGDTSDGIWSCTAAQGDQRSLWWKFKIDQPGFISVAIESDATAANNFTRRLLMQTTPGDSIISTNGSTGLVSLGTGSSTSVPGGGGLQWYRFCVDPGEYYYHVQRCANVDTSNVRAYVYFSTITGDQCFNAPSATSATFGVFPLSVPVVCHSIGDDFGEDGSNMGCLLGPENYKSTWFKFSYTGTELADILFQLNLGSMSNYISAANVRYRLFYGSDCSTMLEGQECSTNAYINNSIACVSGENGDFYVQVVYPESTTGTLGFTFTVSPNSNPDCNPFNPTLLISDFFYQPNCAGDSIIFTNYSTSGSSVEYLWDFGDGETSTETNPIHEYAPGDYDVTLYVINPILADTVSLMQTVTLSPTGSPLELGDDLTICLGESVSIGQSLTQATYQWSTGEASDFISVFNPGWYYLDVVWGGCPYSDSIQIHVIDLAFDLGQDPFFCFGDSVILKPIVYPGVDYLWSDGSIADSLVVSQIGDYYLDISIGNCIQSDTVTVDVLNLNFNLGNDTTICAGSIYTLFPAVLGGVSYLWSDGTTGASIDVQNEGVYSLEISSQGCSAEDEIDIGVLDLSFSLGPDTLFCVNHSVTISPTVEPGVDYSWSDGSTGSSLEINNAGVYYLDIDKIGCHSSDTIYVSELDLGFTLGNDTTICQGTSLTLNPLVLSGVDFDWNTGEATSSIVVNSTGNYLLTISKSGCTATDDVDVSVLDLAFSLGPDSVICFGNSMTIQPQVLAGVNFVWSNGSTQSSMTVSDADTYSLTIDSLGCSAQDEMVVDVFYVDAIVPDYAVICLDGVADIQASGIDSLVWNSNSAVIEQLSFTHFSLAPTDTTLFAWTAYENGCSETGVTQVDVIPPFIPSVIYDDQYCQNEEEVVLPIISGTTGDFYFNNNPIQTFQITGIIPGPYELEYRYVDDVNQCPWQIVLPFSIVDTVALSILSPPVPLCSGDAPVDYSSIVNEAGGQWYAQYNGVDWVATSLFDADIAENEAGIAPITTLLRYELTNADGCLSSIETSVDIQPKPILDIAISDACMGESVVITNASQAVGSNVTTSWNFEQHGGTTQWQPGGIVYTQAGEYNYSLVVTSSYGCTESSDGIITIHPLPVAAFEWDGGCVNESLPFQDISVISEGNITDYSWMVGGVSFGNTPMSSYVFHSSGSYIVKLIVESEEGCVGEITHSVFIEPIPQGVITANNHCFGEEVEIGFVMAASSGNIVSSIWNIPGELIDISASQLVHVFSQPGVFSIEEHVTSENGCENTFLDSIVVYPLPVPSFENQRFELCLLDTDILHATSMVDPPYQVAQNYWDFSNGVSFQGSSVVFKGSSVGFVHLDLTSISNVGCEVTTHFDNVYLVRPNPIADFYLSPDVLTYEQPDMTVLDTSVGGVDWNYAISDGSHYDEAEFIHTIQSSGYYVITQEVINQYGCRDTTSKTIEFKAGLLVYIPNTFTPDNDGINDVFYPVISGDVIEEYHLQIWDRWGVIIFDSTDSEEVWLGNVHGGNYFAMQGVYNYLLMVRGQNMEDAREFKGSVRLLR